MTDAELAALVAEIRPADEDVRAARRPRSTRRRSRAGASAGSRRSPRRSRPSAGSPSQAALDAAIVLAAGDHGYADQGVSAYPPAVTGQMLATFASGGAAISVLARRGGRGRLVVDAGVRTPADHPGVRALRLGAGTADATAGLR